MVELEGLEDEPGTETSEHFLPKSIEDSQKF